MQVRYNLLIAVIGCCLLLGSACVSSKINKDNQAILFNLRDSLITSTIINYRKVNNSDSLMVDSTLKFRDEKYWYKKLKADVCIPLDYILEFTGILPLTIQPINKNQKYFIPDSISKDCNYYDGRYLDGISSKKSPNILMFTPIYRGRDGDFHLICYYYLTFPGLDNNSLLRINSLYDYTIKVKNQKYEVVELRDYSEFLEGQHANFSVIFKSKEH